MVLNDDYTLTVEFTDGTSWTSDEPLMGANADWEATEGEPGYIENKPAIESGSGVGSVIGGNLAYNEAGGQHSTAIGAYTKATGQRSFAHGSMTHAKGRYSHAEGSSTLFNIELTGEQGATVYTYSSPFVSSIVKPIELGSALIIDGANMIDVIAIDDELKTITLSSTLSADSSISKKIYKMVLCSLASGQASHSEGVSVASGLYAHSEGFSIASGMYSHSIGYRTITKHKSQNVSGEFNVEDPSSENTGRRGTYIEIVGNGTEDNARSNARTLDWNGNEWIQGNFKMGGTSYDDVNAKEVATKDYVDTAIADISENKIVSGVWATPQSGQPYLDYDDSSMTDEALFNMLENNSEGKIILKVAFPNYIADGSNNVTTDTRYFYVNNVEQYEFNSNTVKRYRFIGGKSYQPVDYNSDDFEWRSSSEIDIYRIHFASNNEYEYSWDYANIGLNILVDNENIIRNHKIAFIESNKIAFNGLAKAAGDTTQSASSNAVGIYTDNAKASIKAMLGVGGETQKVTVSGTAPVIVANQNTRYVCGEVVSLDFTPSAEGICDVIFTSGSTVTVLTIPNTVIFPEWFDPTTLEANKTYEISISDGVYGAVMIW